jgi:cytoskeletal protein RodZ
MATSLGEKLRNARESRGMSLREVSDQTRISPRYLEAIESDDYRVLPGGVFNKGFVKSYAKYVGVDENEALEEYGKIASTQLKPEPEDSEFTMRRPEVLTDSGGGGNASMIPTIILAILILGLMSWGIIYAVQWYQQQNSQTPVANKPTISPTPLMTNAGNINSAANTNTTFTNANSTTPVDVSGGINAQLKSLTETANVASWTDGKMASDNILTDTPRTYSAENSLKLRYSKWQAKNLELTLNGKVIALPPAPAKPGMNGIEFEINKGNLAQIIQSGQITFENAAPNAGNTNTGNTNTASTNTTTAPAGR